MKRPLITIGLILFCLNSQVLAQNDIQPFGYYLDALRFAQTEIGGSTRVLSMGGAQISLGGDLSMAKSNPAGLGFYNRSEFSITPSVFSKNFNTAYIGETSDNQLSKFNISQLGVAIHSPMDEDGPYKGGTFAFTYTRINDFNNQYSIQGTNPNTSAIDAFVENADGNPPSQFSGNDILSLSYFNYLIGPESILVPPGSDDVYFTDVTGIPLQSDEIRTSGRQQQWSFSYGGNVNDKFYFGLGIGFLGLDYNKQRIYRESYNVDPLSSLLIRENLRIRGSGVNATLGIITRPHDNWRFGFSFATPTLYNLEDIYDASMETDWNNFLYGDAINGDTLLNQLFAETDIITSEYNLVTPMRVNGGLSYFFGKRGFVTADVEYVNYSRTKLSTTDFSMDQDNKAIQQFGTAVVNYRLGAEFRFNLMRFRAGYGITNASLASNAITFGTVQSISGGAGIKYQNFYLDSGIVYENGSGKYSPYDIASGSTPVATFDKSTLKVLFTLGITY